MMKKIMLIAALVVGMSVVGVGEVRADCSMQVRADFNGDGVVGIGEIETVERTENHSVCSYEINTVSTEINFCTNTASAISAVEYKYTCNSSGGWDKSQCMLCQSSDPKNLKNSNSDVTSCGGNAGVSCTTSDGAIRKIGEAGCYDSTHYGVCGMTNEMICPTSCAGTCTSKNASLFDWSMYTCTNTDCPDDNLLNNQQKCVSNKDSPSGKTLYSCVNGKITKTNCTVDQTCLTYVESTTAECHSNLNSDMCTKLEDGTEAGRKSVAGRILCNSNKDKILTCNTPPTFSSEECGSGTKCYEYANENKAECLTSAEAEALGEGVLASDTVTSTTSVYNPLCDGDTGINTAFGCISFSASGFAAKFLQLIFGIAGGVAFLLMVYGFILVATSSGDEKKLQGAKETITSAITGLLVCIFALLLFRIIAVNILQIPGIS